MTEQRTDGTDQYVADEEVWTIEAPEGVEEDDEEAAFEEMIEEMVVTEETALEAKEALPASILPRCMKGEGTSTGAASSSRAARAV